MKIELDHNDWNQIQERVVKYNTAMDHWIRGLAGVVLETLGKREELCRFSNIKEALFNAREQYEKEAPRPVFSLL